MQHVSEIHGSHISPPASTNISSHLLHIWRLGDLKLWIKKWYPLCDRRRGEEHLKILKICCNHLNVIYKGLKRSDTESEWLVQVTTTSRVLEMVTEHSDSWTHPDWKLRDDPNVEDEIL